MSTIKVRKETLLRLTKLVGYLTERAGRRMTYDDVIQYLINNFEGEKKTKNKKVDEATQKLLSYIEKSFLGAGPEDFKEYEYEDFGD